MPATRVRTPNVHILAGSAPLRVVIADDHAVYREGLAHALRRSGIEVTCAVRSAEVAIRVVEKTATDAAILDLQSRGFSGPEAIRRLRYRAPATQVLVMGVWATASDIFDAITAGAIGYLEKHRPVEEIIESIRAAAAGKPLTPAILEPRGSPEGA
jgi:two-component system nitrate/nitrite response regulator NarL